MCTIVFWADLDAVTIESPGGGGGGRGKHRFVVVVFPEFQ